MSDVVVEVTNSERIDVGDGVSIPKAWDAVATGEPNVAGAIRLHVVFDEQLRRTAAASVRLDRAGEGDEVTAAALRDVRVQYLVAVSSTRVVAVTREEGKPESFSQYLAEVRSRTDRTYEETVREAVTLYRIGATVNLAPLKLVSEQLGVSVSTATRMMARAREAGLAEDLITRETYKRMRADDEERMRPHQLPGSPSGPSMGR
ncbi:MULTISPECIES: hypothetical protein [Microbacterium]|uniref:Uncharacterized protein n=1 Tax=Microbacterium saccharophilum TaxID=1213358 RepID=A0A7Z7CXH0_9MICO|nr:MULTISPECIES: hypothetical protein [Microbacterium]SFI21602.1 hypothetical protein SAMN04487751_0434 [Microbacterium saccharophilum]